MMWKTKYDNMLFYIWQDTGKINLLSTIGRSDLTELKRKTKSGYLTVLEPLIQTKYDKYMGRVDKFDKLCTYYCFKRRNKKGYKVLWYFILEAALINAKNAYCTQNEKKD